jgi:hypothetical protein
MQIAQQQSSQQMLAAAQETMQVYFVLSVLWK